MSDGTNRKPLPRWIPTLENMVDDIMLMVAVFILNDRETSDLLVEVIPEGSDWQEWLELYDVEEAERLKLYNRVKSLSGGCKMTFAVLEGSHLIRLEGAAKEYPFSIEFLIAGESTG